MQEEIPESNPGIEPDPAPAEKPPLSFGKAMAAYAVIAVLCLLTLHGNPLFLSLLIVGALALKTWLAQVKRRLE